MNQNPPAATKKADTTMAPSVDFPHLMEVVRASMAACVNDAVSGGTSVDGFEAIRQLFNTAYNKIKYPPDRLRRMALEMNQHLDHVQGLLTGAVTPPPDTPRLFDPTVRYLLSMNYDHAKRVGGEVAARVELQALVKDLTKGTRGTPSKLTVEQLSEAKRLHEQGWTFAQIGTKLHLTRMQIRTALLHHYPEKSAR